MTSIVALLSATTDHAAEVENDRLIAGHRFVVDAELYHDRITAQYGPDHDETRYAAGLLADARAAHECAACTPPQTCDSAPPCVIAAPDGTVWTPTDCWCTLPAGHHGDCQCQPCTERHGAPSWPKPTQETV